MELENTDETLCLTAEHLGSDLMSLVLQELKALPDVWQKLPEWQQGEVIGRARERVKKAVQNAVFTISSNGGVRVVADLDGVAIKNDIKATFVVSRANDHESLQALYDAQGEACLLIVASADEYTGGMDDVFPDPDQKDIFDGDTVEGEVSVGGSVPGIGFDDAEEEDVA